MSRELQSSAGAPEARGVSSPGPSQGDSALAFDLRQETERLQRLLGDLPAGHLACTLVKHPDLRVVLVALNPGARLADHSADACVSILAMKGHLRVIVPGKILDLLAGDFVVLERELPHQVEAVDESVFLLELAAPVRSHVEH